MKYGCIGERLGHSYSAEIHREIGAYDYELCEVAGEDIDLFLRRRDFLGINVTIPYKQTVIPHLHFIDEGARLIGAVNTVVNKDGRLYGYNTDFYGMTRLIAHAGIRVEGKKALILGTGGTSKTARAVLGSLGAREIITVSRKSAEGTCTYEEAYLYHTDAEIIINTTPVGMYPSCYECPIDISKFEGLSGVIDAVYNPLRTRLVCSALERGIPAESGLYMLVCQAVRAAEFFTDRAFGEQLCDKIYDTLLKRKENIVLIGMPASGKTTVGRALALALGRQLVDTDESVSEIAGASIPEIFSRFGEEKFRDTESEAVLMAASEGERVIATGGGAVLRKENVIALRQSGRIYFLDRPLHALIPTEDRPTASTREDIEKRYNERYPIYTSVCDFHIDADCDIDKTVKKIIAEFNGEKL